MSKVTNAMSWLLLAFILIAFAPRDAESTPSPSPSPSPSMSPSPSPTAELCDGVCDATTCESTTECDTCDTTDVPICASAINLGTGFSECSGDCCICTTVITGQDAGGPQVITMDDIINPPSGATCYVNNATADELTLTFNGTAWNPSAFIITDGIPVIHCCENTETELDGLSTFGFSSDDGYSVVNTDNDWTCPYHPCNFDINPAQYTMCLEIGPGSWISTIEAKSSVDSNLASGYGIPGMDINGIDCNCTCSCTVITPSPSPSPSPSQTPSSSPSPSPSQTSTPSPTPTPSPTSTASPTPTATEPCVETTVCGTPISPGVCGPEPTCNSCDNCRNADCVFLTTGCTCTTFWNGTEPGCSTCTNPDPFCILGDDFVDCCSGYLCVMSGETGTCEAITGTPSPTPAPTPLTGCIRNDNFTQKWDDSYGTICAHPEVNCSEGTDLGGTLINDDTATVFPPWNLTNMNWYLAGDEPEPYSNINQMNFYSSNVNTGFSELGYMESTFDVLPGYTYQIVFYALNYNQGPDYNRTVELSLNGVSAMIVDVLPSAASWESFTFQWTSTGTADTIKIESPLPVGASETAWVDDVEFWECPYVSPSPSPSSSPSPSPTPSATPSPTSSPTATPTPSPTQLLDCNVIYNQSWDENLTFPSVDCTDQVGSNCVVPPESTIFAPWNPLPDGVEQICDPVAYDGDCFLDLTLDALEFGGIDGNFTGLTPGTIYMYVIWVANSDVDSDDRGLTLLLDNDSGSPMANFEATQSDSSNLIWERFSYSFTATATEHVLSIIPELTFSSTSGYVDLVELRECPYTSTPSPSPSTTPSPSPTLPVTASPSPTDLLCESEFDFDVVQSTAMPGENITILETFTNVGQLSFINLTRVAIPDLIGTGTWTLEFVNITHLNGSAASIPVMLAPGEGINIYLIAGLPLNITEPAYYNGTLFYNYTCNGMEFSDMLSDSVFVASVSPSPSATPSISASPSPTDLLCESDFDFNVVQTFAMPGENITILETFTNVGQLSFINLTRVAIPDLIGTGTWTLEFVNITHLNGSAASIPVVLGPDDGINIYLIAGLPLNITEPAYYNGTLFYNYTCNGMEFSDMLSDSVFVSSVSPSPSPTQSPTSEIDDDIVFDPDLSEKGLLCAYGELPFYGGKPFTMVDLGETANGTVCLYIFEDGTSKQEFIGGEWVPELIQLPSGIGVGEVVCYHNETDPASGKTTVIIANYNGRTCPLTEWTSCTGSSKPRRHNSGLWYLFIPVVVIVGGILAVIIASRRRKTVIVYDESTRDDSIYTPINSKYGSGKSSSSIFGKNYKQK